MNKLYPRNPVTGFFPIPISPFCFKILLSLLLFFSFVLPVAAGRGPGGRSGAQGGRPQDSDEFDPSLLGNGIDEYGAYVDFQLPISNAYHTDRWVSSGTISVNASPLGTFSSASTGNHTMNFSLQKGIGARLRGSTSTWSGFLTGTTNQVITDPSGNIDGNGQMAVLIFRWYPQQSFLGQSPAFHIYINIAGNSGASNTGERTFDFSASVPTVLSDATLSMAVSANPGNMALAYSYAKVLGSTDASLNSQYTVTHWLNNNTTVVATDRKDNVPASGSIDIAKTNTSQADVFHTKFVGIGGYVVYTSDQAFTMPAYQWPVAIVPVYNDSSGIVTLSWTINSLSPTDAYVKGDNFEIERSLDSTFPSSSTVDKTVSFDGQTTNYSIVDDLSALDVQGTVYYRLRRTSSQSNWEWSTKVAAKLLVNMKILSVSAADSIRLDTSGANSVIVLKWGVDNGVWPSGSRFVIRRTQSDGSQTNTTDITLTDADLRKGTYSDPNINTCITYSYTLIVQPPGSSAYVAPPDVLLKGSILIGSLGVITNLQASKGYYPDRVTLQWHTTGKFSQYQIFRSTTGNFADAVQIDTKTASGNSSANLSYEDDHASPGIYYTYFVEGSSECGGSTLTGESLKDVGFSSPTGNIYGRVTFSSGQAVQGVAVRLENNSGTLAGQSIVLDGTASSFLQLDSLYTPFADTAFSIEAWIRPAATKPANQVVFSRSGQYELGFDAGGAVYFSSYTNKVTAVYTNAAQSFFHVAGVYKHDSLVLYINGQQLASKAVATTPGGAVSKTVFIGKNASGNNFTGNIDEMRVWNRSLASDEVNQNYTRMLVGNEKGLIAYWRWDETIADRFFDLSRQADVFNRNDGYMDPGSVKHSTVVPSTDQLALKDFTDTSGNYMISGVPYTDNGITYTVIPTMGIHQFDPISVNRLLSASSNQFTVDFTDKSSFPVSGTIFYHNSTIPVQGVQFLIDGVYATKSNSDIITSDASGNFSISVPVGTHEVKASKLNHVFENGGLITDRNGHNLNYQDAISERILYDSTTVRWIGRVAGGSVQEAFAVGHSLSHNNLGQKLSVTLQLTGAQNRMINASETHLDSLVTVNHLLSGSTSGSTSGSQQGATHATTVDYKTYTVVIQPDVLTGEFEVNLFPENYTVTTVAATGHTNLLGNNPVNVDLTSVFAVQNEVANGDTAVYNYKYQFIDREAPAIKMNQLDGAGDPMDYFGDLSYSATALNGSSLLIPVRDTTNKNYLFGYPVFTQNKPYTFQVNAFEQYSYFMESDLQTAASVENVPTTDGTVSIINNLRDGASGPDTLSLDSLGQGNYQFYAGTPEMSNGIGRKGFSMSVQIGAQTITWNNGATQEGYIMGGRKTGSDFVTQGPNDIVTILRDPPGSNSSAYLNKGTSISTTVTGGAHGSQTGADGVSGILGTEVEVSTGLGIALTNKTEVINTTGASITHSENWQNDTTKTVTTTFNSTFSTSSDPAFVGADGDVFIGNATNITYGTTVNMTVVPNAQISSTDEIFLDGRSNNIGYSIVQRTGINANQQFATFFAYPQSYIENTLIPNLTKLRNSFLLPRSTSASDAQARADNLKTEVYVSKLDTVDKRFGASNSDSTLFGTSASGKGTATGPSYTIYLPSGTGLNADTVMTINQFITAWKNELTVNEQRKLGASRLVNNYSFTGASSVQVSEENDIATTRSSSFDFVVGVESSTQLGFTVNKTGLIVTLDEAVDGGKSSSSSSENTTTQTYGFTLSETGTDYLSVDVLKDADSSYFFRTKGGVTQCPYEGVAVTKYYQPGTVLDQPTMQAEVPSLSVAAPVVSNVPSSRPAAYTVQLYNASDLKTGGDFILRVADASNPDGAKVYMDGAELGSGRAVSVPGDGALTKTITLERGPSAMDYNNIQLILQSSCQSSVADTIMISAHFIPSCSDVHLSAPVNQWVLNTASPVNESGDYYLPITIDQFDINNSLFDHIELQYKSSSSSIWITQMKYYSDSGRYGAAQGDKLMITENGVINYNFVMNAVAFSDQAYDIRAVSVCMDGTGQVLATTATDISTGVKDSYAPRPFGTPQPANGILGIGEDIRLNLNETIAGGLLSQSDFQVTGIRNGSASDHSVAIQLDGQNDQIKTEFVRNLAAKNITVEMWALPNQSADGTLFSQGSGTQTLEMALTGDNYLEVTVGAVTVRSEKPVSYQQGVWSHIAMVLDATNNKVSAYYNFQPVITGAAVSSYSGAGIIEIGKSISKNGNYFAGKIHEMRLWSAVVTATQLQQRSLSRLSGSETGLLSYYPMNEGKGTVVYDKARGVNATLTGEWSIPAGKAVALAGNGYVKLNTSYAPITKDMDYTLELWFKGIPGQADAALLSSGSGDTVNVGGSSADLFFLGFEGGKLVFRNNGVEVSTGESYLDNNWHHVAVAVNRNSDNGQLLVDGLLKNTFDITQLGGIAAASTLVGARAVYTKADDGSTRMSADDYFTGNIDEVRFWNTYLSQSILSQNNNTGLQGDEFGLMAYYPFSKYFTFQNNQELGYALSDMKTQDDANTVVPDAVATNALESDESAPVKSLGPVANLQFSYVVNNDALVITLQEPSQSIDKTIVTFKAKNIRDQNGNPMESPVTWTAYIDQDPLKWSDETLTFSKDLYADLSFTAQIANQGGSMENFNLANLPAWLTATPSSGTVGPNATQVITFTVNKGLNVGSYQEVVSLINDQQETEALGLNLTVHGPKPDWQVNPSDFKYNMTVYGRIRTNGVFSVDSADKVAAFANGKCVGVANNQYFQQNDNWYTLFTVYGDSLRQSNLEFRIWEASTGKTYLATPAPSLTFVNDTIFGSPKNPVIFDGAEMQFQNISINQGWNWISFGLSSPSLGNVGTTLANGQWASGDVVKNEELGFDQYSSADGWIGYLPGFNNTSMYMLNTANEQTLSVSGTLTDIAHTRIQVKGGRWNYISYLPQVNISLEEALADYPAYEGDVIKSQTGFAMYDPQNGWIGNLTFLEPGKGYMLYRGAGLDTSFVYPTISGIMTGMSAVPGVVNGMASTPVVNQDQAPVSSNYAYSQNMTVAAVTDTGFQLQSGDRILAYANGELRGEAGVVDNSVTHQQTRFFNIAGGEAQSVYFVVERNGSVVGRSVQPVVYSSNSSLGSLRSPFVIRFGKEKGEINIKAYPNPFRETVTITVDLAAERAVADNVIQISVYDLSGRIVYQGGPVSTTANHYEISWNGRNSGGGVCTPGVYMIYVTVNGKKGVFKITKI